MNFQHELFAGSGCRQGNPHRNGFKVLWLFGRSHPIVLLLALLVLMPGALQGQVQQAPDSLRVLSFNIRYGTANDGENRWENRQELVLETIARQDADLIGLQEALSFQIEFLRSQLPQYTLHGAGRDDGKGRGEFSAVLYRTDRFDRIEDGHFWLSESPNVPGSKSWDTSLTRMVSWVWLRETEAPHRQIIFANTHFDHRGAVARLESAKLIREQLVKKRRPLPIVLTGDFNTTEDDRPYQVLTSGDPLSSRLIDSYRSLHPTRTTKEATFGGWTGQREGNRIDWVLHSQDFETTSAVIDYHSKDGRYPSDHYPVAAVLQWRQRDR